MRENQFFRNSQSQARAPLFLFAHVSHLLKRDKKLVQIFRGDTFSGIPDPYMRRAILLLSRDRYAPAGGVLDRIAHKVHQHLDYLIPIEPPPGKTVPKLQMELQVLSSR